MEFLRKIKTRIALSFTLLFLIVAVPAIIYALHQVNMFFEGLYLEQMRATAMTVSALFSDKGQQYRDSLTTSVSDITSSSAFLLNNDNRVVSGHYETGIADSSTLLTEPIPSVDSSAAPGKLSDRVINSGLLRYLQVQVNLPGGMKLLQVKSLTAVSMLIVRMREVIIWASFLGLVALVAVAFWVSANITRPLEQLTVFAQKIRSSNLPDKTEIRSPDEVGDLADALNELVDNLRQTSERLARLENMRRDFFANVSEQLKTPLLNIQADVETLLRGEINDRSAAREILEKALQQSRNLERLIHALIEISKMEFGEATLEMRTLSLNHLMRGVAAVHRSQAENKGLKFELSLPPQSDSVTVFGDERLLKVALSNLVSNAVDFTDRGFVRIACFDEGEKVKVAVEDSGRGIPQEQIDRIFERLYSADTLGRKDLDRMGLGLAIAKHIMDAHEQHLDVESTLGVGSRFSFGLRKYHP